MSSIAHTQPRTGRRHFNLRAYLAGTAATAALIGAVVLAFASLGAYVAFNGLPIGGSDAEVEASSVAVGPATSTSNRTDQRTSQDAATADVRRTQSSSGAASGVNGNAAGSASQAATATGTVPTPANAGSQPTVVAGGSQETATPAPTQSGPSADPPSSQIPTPHVTAPGAVGGTVGTVEQTLQEVGVEAPINGSGSAVEEVTGLLGGN